MEQTVFAYYHAILRRDPSSVELNAWRNTLDNATDIADALDDFAIALCSQADDVRSVLRLYQAVFDRMSDSGGLTFWTNIFRQVQEVNPELNYRNALIETIGSWLESDEYVARFGDNLSDSDFLSLLYLNILGRPSDQGGYDFWLSILQSGALTRQQLIVEFTESDEFKAQVDGEADALLKAAAAIDSDAGEDDLPYDFPDGHPYTGELANEAPQDILEGQADNLGQNATQGELAAWLRAVDPDGGEVFRWTLIDDADGAFRIADPDAQQPEIAVADPAKLVGSVMSVRVRVTDREGNTFDKDIAITIDESNSAPFDLELSNRVIDEQDGSVSNPGAAGTVAGLLSAQDADTGDILVFEVVGDPRFDIANGNQLIIADPAAFDAEAGIASTSVTIRVTDRAGNGLSVERTFTIDVTPIVDEDPINLLPETLYLPSTTQANVTLADLLAQDPDTSADSHTFSIVPGGDPTGGAFALDGTGTKLVLVDPSLLDPNRLIDGLSPEQGGVDLDGTADGFVVFDLPVRITDSAGNSLQDTIRVTVEQFGDIIPFTGTISETLEGTGRNDYFLANAGIGPTAPVPGFNRTANAGDTAFGGDGLDTFSLLKDENNMTDGGSLVTGVTLQDVERVLIGNRDESDVPAADTSSILADICTPLIEMPGMAPAFDEPVIFDASLSPDVDRVMFETSIASAGIWNLQEDFWNADPTQPGDVGPQVDLYNVNSNFFWVDSAAGSKSATSSLDELTFNLENAVVNDLRISENVSGSEPGGPRSEQVGTIRLKASGEPSVIGSISNGYAGGERLLGWPESFPASFQPTTHTLILDVDDLTESRPSAKGGAAAAALNTAAIDMFVGQVFPIGTRLTGLENVNITGGGDVFLVFAGSANDADSDANGFPLEVVDGAGNGFFFFDEGGFATSRIDAGGGFDTLGLYAEDIDGTGEIRNVERIVVLETLGTLGRNHLDLGAVQDDSVEDIVLANGVSGDLRVVSIPGSSEEPDTENLNGLTDRRGSVLTFDQCCNDNGNLPNDFDLFLGGSTPGVAVDTIFRIDPNGSGTQSIDNFNSRDIETLHVHLEDCNPLSTGLFEISHLGSQDFSLQTLVLSDQGAAGTTRVLNDGLRFDSSTSNGFFTELNHFGPQKSASINLVLIDGANSNRDLEFLTFDGPQAEKIRFLRELEDWAPDPGNDRPVDLGYFSSVDNVDDELVVSDDGVLAVLGNGDDIFSGNRITANGSEGHLGADFIFSGEGNDLVFGAAGNDQIQGGRGHDELQGERGDDNIFADEGNDLVLAGSGNDYVEGGDGYDIVFGGDGNDLLRGGDGFDAICGDNGDDSLFGDALSDLLIGGKGDDFVDAGGAEADLLFGDYGCGPQTAVIEIPDEFNNWDEFHIGIDFDGDKTMEFIASAVAEPIDNAETIADSLANRLNAELQQHSDLIQSRFDISADGNQLVIQRSGDEAPLVEYFGFKTTVPSVHKAALGGLISTGDEFVWSITWSGGTNILYAYEFHAPDAGVNLNQVLSGDGLVDTANERQALAADIVEHFEQNRPAPLALAGFRMELDVDGNICLFGPSSQSAETPTVAVGGFDGFPADLGSSPQVSKIDFGTGGGFSDIGDILTIAINNETVDVEVAGFMLLVDIAARAADLINTAQTGFHVTATIDPIDPSSVILTSRFPGEAFSVDVSVNDDTVDDEIAIFNILDIGPGNIFGLMIDSTPIGLSIGSFAVEFNTDRETTLNEFVARHASDILTNHDLTVEIEDGALILTRANAPIDGTGSVAGGPLGSIVFYQSDATVDLTVVVDQMHSPSSAPTVSLVSAAEVGEQDLTQSLTTVSQAPATIAGYVDYEETVVPATTPDQDVFVTAASFNDIATFGEDGFDNDRLPHVDMFDLLKTAGLSPLINGPDEGIIGVVHVLDFNQGGGGDLLHTFDVNEAIDKEANTTVDGRFWRELDGAFGADDDRRQGDKIAFRKTDGELDECGKVGNYAASEGSAESRDDADTGAVAAFGSDSGLRHYANARTFEDALLDNHGLRWGLDITQAIVDDAINDLADDGVANNSAGGLASGSWGNAADLLGGGDALDNGNIYHGILDQAKGQSWLRVYYNEAGTDAAPEAVMELVGLDSLTQFSFADIVGHDCITDADVTQDREDLWLAA